jgi:hypothetical protein
MKKHEKALLYFEEIENLIPYMGEETQSKMEFAKYFLNTLPVKYLENNRISIGPMDKQTFLFLIFSIVIEYSFFRKPLNPQETSPVED